MNSFAKEKIGCIERLDNLLFELADKIRKLPNYPQSDDYKSDITKINAHYSLLFRRLTGNMGENEIRSICQESDLLLKPLLAEQPPQ